MPGEMGLMVLTIVLSQWELKSSSMSRFAAGDKMCGGEDDYFIIVASFFFFTSSTSSRDSEEMKGNRGHSTGRGETIRPCDSLESLNPYIIVTIMIYRDKNPFPRRIVGGLSSMKKSRSSSSSLS